jgi:hypothetical protein
MLGAILHRVGESEAVAHSTQEAENFLKREHLKREQQLREAPARPRGPDHDPHY